MTDPIADMLTRIRNALIARHKSLEIPASRIKIEIARVLKEEGYVKDYTIYEQKPYKKVIKLEPGYTAEGRQILKEIHRESKPGKRIYVNKNDIPRVKGGLGITVLSTSRGIMTGTEARRLGIGGEILCSVV